MKAIETVFVSYSQPDETMGASLVQCLKQEGFTVWFAPEVLQPGDSFNEIFDQIDRCDAFIVLLSPNSAESPWVNKELDVAITRQLSARPMLLIPAYLKQMDTVRKVSDLKSLDLHEDEWDEGVNLLISRLRGQEKGEGPLMQSFEAFFNSLVRIDNTEFKEVLRAYTTLRLFSKEPQTRGLDSSLEKVNTKAQERALNALIHKLQEANISKGDRERILEAAKRGLELPIVNRSHLVELRRFARRTDKIVIRFAEHLWHTPRLRGVTHSWIVEYLRKYLGEHFPIEDEELLDWKAESLVDEARAAGLLVRSTEEAMGYAAWDAIHNPSYDLGPMVRVAGRLVAAFMAEPAVEEQR